MECCSQFSWCKPKFAHYIFAMFVLIILIFGVKFILIYPTFHIKIVINNS